VPGTPVFISVYVETKPTNARIINLTALGRFRLEISCACTEFKLARLGNGPVVFQHKCNKHDFGWYDGVNLPADSYRATAEAKKIHQIAASRPTNWIGNAFVRYGSFWGILAAASSASA
jgi:hypothetical protein